jgi:hypothetical protein
VKVGVEGQEGGEGDGFVPVFAGFCDWFVDDCCEVVFLVAEMSVACLTLGETHFRQGYQTILLPVDP